MNIVLSLTSKTFVLVSSNSSILTSLIPVSDFSSSVFLVLKS